MTKVVKPESKNFSLKVHETNMLNFVRNHQQIIFSALLSTIAMDRLSYTVTEKTQFNLNADLTEMTLTEIPEDTETESPIKTAE